jgi:branched-chain amino acid transport system permease protein
MKFWLVRLASIAVAVGLCFFVTGWAKGVLTDYGYTLVVLSGLYVTLAVSLNLINGITGQFSIGHAGFYMVGAYTSAILTQRLYAQQSLGPEMWTVAMALAGAVTAAIAGFVVGLPSLRLRGDYLAIVTLGFGEIIRIIVQNQEALGGSYGIEAKMTPSVDSAPWVWMLAVLCIAVCRNLLKSAHGLPFLAVREDEVASAAMGVDVTKVKVTAFVVGSMFAGAAGGLFAPFISFITPDTFRMDQSFIILTMVVLGGTGSITGSVVAAVALFGIPEYLRLLKDPSTGQALTLSGATVAAVFLAVGLMVWGMRTVGANVHGSSSRRLLPNLGVLGGAGIVGWLLSLALSNVPQLAASRYDMNLLRMVIFAMALIVLMLLRPQGIFAHHEFSWAGVGRLFKRQPQGAPA